MLLETTVDDGRDAIVRLRWHATTGKAKAVPTIAGACGPSSRGPAGARCRRFTDYRPGSSEALFLCEKTDELRGDADLSDVVTAHRRE